jgi:hypothetical protein
MKELMLGPKFGKTVEGVQGEFKAFVEGGLVTEEVA